MKYIPHGHGNWKANEDNDQETDYSGDWIKGKRDGFGEARVKNQNNKVWRGLWSKGRPLGHGVLGNVAGEYNKDGDFVMTGGKI